MKIKFRFIFLIVPIVLLLVCVKFIARVELNAYYQDIIEISDDIKTSKLEFASERSFGNDRFDVYSFTLKNEDWPFLSDLAEQFTRGYRGMKNMLENELSNDTTLLKSVKELITQNASKYMYVRKGGTTKLYVYASMQNKGYCLILTI